MKLARPVKVLKLWVPPIIPVWLYKAREKRRLPSLPDEFSSLPRSQHGLFKLIRDYSFDSVLDVGSGSGEHADVLAMHGKDVIALDFGTSIYAKAKKSEQNSVSRIEADFYEASFDRKFDCVWASHVLEHQPNPGLFIGRCMDLTRDDGIIAITVPPLKNQTVGGHLTLWNAGTLLYQLVFNGLDCRDAAICSYGYNITVIVKNKKRDKIDLTWDNGDIHLLKNFFPEFVDEPFDGRIEQWNW